MKPIYDTWSLEYKSIFGAVKQFETVSFSIRLPKELPLDFPPVLVLFRTGFKERFLNMNDVQEDGDSFIYTVDYNARYSDVHYYYFSYMENSPEVHMSCQFCWMNLFIPKKSVEFLRIYQEQSYSIFSAEQDGEMQYFR